MFFADYKHFNTSPLWVKATNNIDMFRTLAFYNTVPTILTLRHMFSMTMPVSCSNVCHFLAGKLFREKLFFNGLITADHKPYYEFGYGIDQVFLLFNAEIVTGFSGGKHRYTGVRIGIPDKLLLFLF
jgi:hypothetical protein